MKSLTELNKGMSSQIEKIRHLKSQRKQDDGTEMWVVEELIGDDLYILLCIPAGKRKRNEAAA